VIKTLADYIQEFRDRGTPALTAEVTAPILIQVDEGEDEDERAYQTAYMPNGDFQLRGPTGPPGGERVPVDNLQPDRQKVYPIAKRAGGAFQDRVGVGRAPNVDVSVALPRLSKYHAFFTWEEDGSAYYLTDAGSKNGTQVDGKMLEVRQATPVQNGSTVELGPYRFLFFTPEGFRELVSRKG
jgi:hypothetical protein